MRHGPAVRRGRQIKRRRAGAAAAGGTVALGTAGVLAAFTLSGAPSHPTAVAVAVSSGPAGRTVAPSPSYTHPATPPTIRPDAITASVIQDALEYALPSAAQVNTTGGFSPNTNVELVDPTSHSWYVQTAIGIKSAGLGTSVAISVTHTGGSDSCAAIVQGWGNKGQCTQSSLDGGQLFKTALPLGVVSNDGVYETLEWLSPSGYATSLQLGDTTVDDIALTNTQADAVLTNQVFAEIAHALPSDACVGGTFSQPVDSPTPGQSPIEHVRCSTNGTLYPASA
jgi:hypothetical protein